MTTTTTHTAADPRVARGTLHEVLPATATRPGFIVFHTPTSSYQLHLIPQGGVGAVKAQVGKRIAGVIRCEGRRVDVVKTGGRLVEPVYGRPRRIHGTVMEVDAAENTLTVNAGGGAAVDSGNLPVVVKLVDPRNKAAEYPVGALVAFDVLEGATFEER